MYGCDEDKVIIKYTYRVRLYYGMCGPAASAIEPKQWPRNWIDGSFFFLIFSVGVFFFYFLLPFFFFLLSRGSWHAYTHVRCIFGFSLFALPIFTIYVYIRTLFFFSLISHFIYCAVCCNDCVAVIWMMEQWCHQPYYYDWLKLSWMCAERKEHVPT